MALTPYAPRTTKREVAPIQVADAVLAPPIVGDTQQLTRTRDVVTPDPLPAPAPKVGSPLDTLYGVDSESFLTDDQRKMMRMIQGRFDASANRRDRELQRYGAPRLSSYALDESLARAIAGAQALNRREPEVPQDPFRDVRAPAANRDGRTLPTSDYSPPTPKGPTSQQYGNQWQRILTGLTSLAPLLFGKDAYGNFLNKGLIQWAKEKAFGPEAAQQISDEQLERLLDSQGANNSWDILPTANPDPFGIGGYDNDWGAALSAPVFSDTGSWWDSWWTPDSGGDYLDLFGGV